MTQEMPQVSKAKDAPMTKEDEFDVRSAEPVLYYAGPGFVTGVPADDLSGSALARVAWMRLRTKRPDSPTDMSQAAIAALRDELLATGKYASKPADPAEATS